MRKHIIMDQLHVLDRSIVRSMSEVRRHQNLSLIWRQDVFPCVAGAYVHLSSHTSFDICFIIHSGITMSIKLKGTKLFMVISHRIGYF